MEYDHANEQNAYFARMYRVEKLLNSFVPLVVNRVQRFPLRPSARTRRVPAVEALDFDLELGF